MGDFDKKYRKYMGKSWCVDEGRAAQGFSLSGPDRSNVPPILKTVYISYYIHKR